ncbi:MAG: hypothetical protein KDA96_25045, partial [Planctomycetaceae bacterium]|nr:hypothetical protein [Planctomycetaceae bacterium]
RQWSHSPDVHERMQPGFLGDHSEWGPRIWFFVLPDAKWIVEKDDTSEVKKWKDEWRRKGTDYVQQMSNQFDGEEQARSEAPKQNAYDAWMRFVAQGSKYPELIRAAIRSSRNRCTPGGQPEGMSRTELDQWGRELLQPNIDDLHLAIQEKIQKLDPQDRIQRLVERAIACFQERQTQKACHLIDLCLNLFPDPKRVHDELLSEEGANADSLLKPLIPFLHFWRERQGK